MAKLSRKQFARLIGYVTFMNKGNICEADIDMIDHLCEIEEPQAVEPVRVYYNNKDVELLLQAMHNGRKIEAIKYHRLITGFPLKESKDVIERWWIEPAKVS